ncbi:hypothetical protein BJY00DRAFT_68240 [Aspergillus carlsbadensis]|nr:hypothetical protein BJY00DRAFT_68240 [Aspergillus carlsbadensis]
MIVKRVGAGLIALALGFLPVTMAQDSTSPSICSGLGTYYHTIEQQADVDEMVETGCTELDGQITIRQTYSGPLTFPGLTNLTGRGIQLEEGSQITLIDFPDLIAIEGSLELNASPTLVNVSMPKLEEISGTLLGRFPLDVYLYFRSLTSVDGLDLIGNLTSIPFDLLETVYGVLKICNSEDCDSKSFPAQGTMNVSLQVLTVAHAFYVEGKASQISAPRLRAIPGTVRPSGTEEVNTPDGLMLNVTGAVSISFPEITRIEPLAAVNGEIESLNLDSLTSYPGEGFTLHTDTTLSLDLPVEELPSPGLILSGRINSVRLPNLGHGFFNISSELPLDCESLIDEVVARSGNGAVRSNVHCTSADSEHPAKSDDAGMSVGWRAGLSVIIVAAVALLAFLGFWIYKRHKKIVQAKALAEEHELSDAASRPPARVPAPDPAEDVAPPPYTGPPPYTPRAEER